MNPKAVIRSLEEKETELHAFRYKHHEGSLTIVNGVVENISLSVECVERVGPKEKALRRTIDDLPLPEAKSLYLILRSMLKITGDLEELDACVL
jgi:hypothetical protein